MLDRAAKNFFAVSLLVLALMIISNLVIDAENFPDWGLPVALVALGGSLALWVLMWLEDRQAGEASPLTGTAAYPSVDPTGALQLPQSTAREWVVSTNQFSDDNLREVQVPVPHSEIQADTSRGADKPPLSEEEMNSADHDTAAPSREAQTGETFEPNEDVAAEAVNDDNSDVIEAARQGDQLAEAQVGEAMAWPRPDPDAQDKNISGYNVGNEVDRDLAGGPYDEQSDVAGDETPGVHHVDAGDDAGDAGDDADKN